MAAVSKELMMMVMRSGAGLQFIWCLMNFSLVLQLVNPNLSFGREIFLIAVSVFFLCRSQVGVICNLAEIHCFWWSDFFIF